MTKKLPKITKKITKNGSFALAVSLILDFGILLHFLAIPKHFYHNSLSYLEILGILLLSIIWLAICFYTLIKVVCVFFKRFTVWFMCFKISCRFCYLIYVITLWLFFSWEELKSWRNLMRMQKISSFHRFSSKYETWCGAIISKVLEFFRTS